MIFVFVIFLKFFMDMQYHYKIAVISQQYVTNYQQVHSFRTSDLSIRTCSWFWSGWSDWFLLFTSSVLQFAPPAPYSHCIRSLCSLDDYNPPSSLLCFNRDFRFALPRLLNFLLLTQLFGRLRTPLPSMSPSSKPWDWLTPYSKASEPTVCQPQLSRWLEKNWFKTKTLFFLLPFFPSSLSAGFDTPTSVQSNVIPRLLKRENIVMASSTGSGKTLAFTVPIMQLMAEQEAQGYQRQKSRPRCLVLVPTRELAKQVLSTVKSISHFSKASSTSITGGDSYKTQQESVRKRGKGEKEKEQQFDPRLLAMCVCFLFLLVGNSILVGQTDRYRCGITWSTRAASQAGYKLNSKKKKKCWLCIVSFPLTAAFVTFVVCFLSLLACLLACREIFISVKFLTS